MIALLYAAVTVIAWGTWLVPSQKVRFSGQQVRAFYVTITNLIISGAIAAPHGLETLTPATFWLPFSGGIVWALGGWAAFAATEWIGVVRAYGLWAPLNIVVSILFGALLFEELVSLNPRTTLVLCGSLALIIGGVLMIIFSRRKNGGKASRRALAEGSACALAAGFLWAAYYIPIKISKASMWIAAFPMACGMFFGCLLIVVACRKGFRLDNLEAYLRTAASGALWSCGNYGMLLLVQALGAGRGYTISQLAVVVNALCGIYLLKDPEPKSRGARLALTGCDLATVGGILLGRLK